MATNRPRRTEPLRARPVRTEPLRAARPPRITPLVADPVQEIVQQVKRQVPLQAQPLANRPLQASPMSALRPPRINPLQAAPINTSVTSAITGGSPGLVHIPGLGSGMSAREILGSQATRAGAAGGVTGLLSRARGAMGSKQVLPNVSGMKRVGLGVGVGIGSDFLADAVDEDGGLVNRVISGAGTGAGFGLMSKNPWVIAGGTVAGGIAGALGLLGGGKEKSGLDTEKLEGVMSELGMPLDSREQVMSMFEIEKEALGEDVAKQNLVNRLNTAYAEAQMAEQSVADEERAQAQMLAQQAIAAQFFQPFAQDMINSAQQRFQMVQNQLPNLPENYRGIAASQAAAALDSSTRLAKAYQAQTQMIPAMAAFQDQQSQINSIAAQLQQSGMQNALDMAGLNGAPQGGAASLAELLAGQAGG